MFQRAPRWSGYPSHFPPSFRGSTARNWRKTATPTGGRYASVQDAHATGSPGVCRKTFEL